MATLTDNTNYLQATGFQISISRENFPNMEFFASSVSHPGTDIASVEMPRARASIPFAGDRLNFGQLSVTILIDEDMNSYIEMFQWLERMVQQPNTDRARSFENNVIPTEASITVSVLTSHNNVSRRIKYYNCVPTSLSDIELTAQRTDTDPLSFIASFRFAYFEIV